jgi:hypothetical protein
MVELKSNVKGEIDFVIALEVSSRFTMLNVCDEEVPIRCCFCIGRICR